MQYPPSAPLPHTTTTVPAKLCTAAAHACGSLPRTGIEAQLLFLVAIFLVCAGLGALLASFIDR